MRKCRKWQGFLMPRIDVEERIGYTHIIYIMYYPINYSTTMKKEVIYGKERI